MVDAMVLQRFEKNKMGAPVGMGGRSNAAVGTHQMTLDQGSWQENVCVCVWGGFMKSGVHGLGAPLKFAPPPGGEMTADPSFRYCRVKEGTLMSGPPGAVWNRISTNGKVYKMT